MSIDYRNGDMTNIQIQQVIDPPRQMTSLKGSSFLAKKVYHSIYLSNNKAHWVSYAFGYTEDENPTLLHINRDDCRFPEPPAWFEVEWKRMKLWAKESVRIDAQAAGK